MARTQTVLYRDEHGVEPVDEFIEALPPKPAAKIDVYIDDHLNGKEPDAPPPVGSGRSRRHPPGGIHAA